MFLSYLVVKSWLLENIKMIQNAIKNPKAKNWLGQISTLAFKTTQNAP